MIGNDVWTEQESFDRLLRPEDPTSGSQVAEFVRDMSLNIMSELDELMRTTTWKRHRRVSHHRPNREQRLEEVVDIFKLWLATAQGLGFTQAELLDAFWRKSMVVRQRHSEEWVKTLDRKAAVVDIDNVLCDYTTGFCNWLINRAPLFAKAAKQIRDGRKFFNRAEDFGMSETEWQGFKHEFRSQGHKRHLPVMPGADEFLQKLHVEGYYIILLTSRPIDKYPNIYSDTVYWLRDNRLEYDWLWWSVQKGEVLIERNVLKFIRFVVDDDRRFTDQFTKLGLKTYWLRTTVFNDDEWNAPSKDPLLISVAALHDIAVREGFDK